MKKVYEKPQFEIEEFEVKEDILTLSSNVGGLNDQGYGAINQ